MFAIWKVRVYNYSRRNNLEIETKIFLKIHIKICPLTYSRRNVLKIETKLLFKLRNNYYIIGFQEESRLESRVHPSKFCELETISYPFWFTSKIDRRRIFFSWERNFSWCTHTSSTRNLILRWISVYMEQILHSRLLAANPIWAHQKTPSLTSPPDNLPTPAGSHSC